MNKELIDQFKVLYEYFKEKGDRGRSIAYNKAVSSLRTVGNPIRSINDVKSVRGIGPKIREKIQEYLDTGEIKTVEDKRNEMKVPKTKSKKEKTVDLFKTVWGVGNAKANELYKKGMESIQDLKDNPELLNRSQRIGLKHYDDLLLKIPRYVITSMLVIFKCYLNNFFGKHNYKMEIAGSYRRKKEESGDIDMLITAESFGLKDVVDLMSEKGIIVEILAMKKTKFMGIAGCLNGVGKPRYFRLDIEFVPRDEWGSALLYFTGSREFNVYMRAEAKRQGMLLNEHGLYDVNSGKKKLKSPSERDIFDRLGVRYTSPRER